MKNIHDLSYPIYFEKDDLNMLKTYVFEHAKETSFYIITDDIVGGYYTDAIKQVLPHIKGVVEIPSSERSKSIHTYEDVTNRLLSLGMKKTDGIIGLGGGVVGDLSGFVAATIFRGVPYIAIPTTLLAQVDSSIGSKVGINTSLGKNLLGAFKDPLFVFIYPGFLKTLSTRELNNGLAEVIKAGFIQDATILSDLESNVDLNNVIYKAVKVKVAVVLNDPLERHERKTLNFGHTLGHAIEKGFLYEGIKHGEAISHGMIFALKLGIKLHITSNETLDYALTLLNKYHLLDIQIGSYETYLNDVIYDKKSDVKGIDFILITKPGNVLIKHIPYGELNVD